MKRIRTPLLLGAFALALSACGQEPATEADVDATATADGMQNPVAADLDAKVMAALSQCADVEPSCGMGMPAGYLVFPDVTEVALGVGGAGGDGALVQNGEIVSYWRMGEGSVGLQAGVQAASYVFKISDPAMLQEYVDSGEWSIGADAGITVAEAGANVQAGSEASQVYVFNAEGLMADVSIDALKIWRTDELSTGGNATTDMTATDTTD